MEENVEGRIMTQQEKKEKLVRVHFRDVLLLAQREIPDRARAYAAAKAALRRACALLDAGEEEQAVVALLPALAAEEVERERAELLRIRKTAFLQTHFRETLLRAQAALAEHEQAYLASKAALRRACAMLDAGADEEAVASRLAALLSEEIEKEKAESLRVSKEQFLRAHLLESQLLAHRELSDRKRAYEAAKAAPRAACGYIVKGGDTTEAAARLPALLQTEIVRARGDMRPTAPAQTVSASGARPGEKPIPKPQPQPRPVQLDVQRVEKKYAMPLMDAYRLLGRMSLLLHRDENAQNGAYLVRSLYFDTVYDGDYYEKMDGLCDRRKIRLRVYDPDAASAKLELKEKFGNLQRKRSITVTREEARRMMACDYAWLYERPEPVAAQLHLLLNENAYVPKCVVEYDRTAFFVPENDIRITFDERVRASAGELDVFSPTLRCLPVMAADEVILEVKYNGFLLSYVKELAGNGIQMPVSASKYTLSRGVSGLY